MTTKSSRATLVAALLAATASAAILVATDTGAVAQVRGARAQDALARASGPQTSGAVGRIITNVQKMAQEKDFAGASAELAKADAIANKSPYDLFKLNQMILYVDAQTGDMAGAGKAAQIVADSTFQTPEEKPANLTTAIDLSLLAKDYPAAIKYAKELDSLNPTDPRMIDAISNAFYFGGDFASAKTAAQKRIDADIAAKRTPSRNALQVLLSAQVGLKDDAAAQTTLEQEIMYYNDPADWAQMIDISFGTPGLRDIDAIWLGRLLFLVGAPVSQNNADMIGQIASKMTFFGDAVNAKGKGGKMEQDPAPRADEDRKSIQEQISAGAAQNGTYNAKLAEALYSYGMYPEAETAAKAAVAKGGNPDPSEAPMVLGQAQAAQGKYDDALASFGSVTGGGPATARAVKLWTIYVNIKKNPPAPVAATPAQATAR